MRLQASTSGGTARRAGRLLPVALAALLLLPPVAALGQDDCQIPLFVQQYGADANLMFLIDNSGSMNHAIYAPGYDADVVYTGVFEPDWEYFIAKDGWYDLDDFNAAWSIYGEQQAYLIESDNGEDGRYYGNYLNWIYFHATEAQRLAIPRMTRIQVTKLILSEIVGRTEDINMSVTVFHLYGPGNILGKLGKNKQALLSNIKGITANKWTPTGESMESILDYFTETGVDGAIQSYCQPNFLVIMTDGLPTYDEDVSPYLWDADGDGNDPGSCASIGAPYPEWQLCSDHMDDVAYYMYNEDLRPDMPEQQYITTYTIGFHVDAPLLAETAKNGNGRYYTASNAAELIYAFNSVMYDIIKQISSGSAVAVISTERGTEDRMIRGKFMPGSWEGFLESFAIPYTEGAQPVWEAGRMLAQRSPATRRIFTALGTNVYDFDVSNTAHLMGPMDCAFPDTAEMVIRWTRGERVDGLRPRGDWKLGDIVSSTPVVVGPPRSFIPDPAHQEYLATYADREKMIYVGANDGMMHAFWADTGVEAWAFVPEFALPKLWAIADSFYCHVFSCDQTVSASDVKLGGAWRTVLAAGGREGGAGYFAMDVTDPTGPDLLWQVTLPDGHAFSSEVEFANIAGRSVALMGSGLDEVTGEAWLYAYDVATGDLLGSHLLSDLGVRNKTTRPKAVDVDLDGQADVLYVADMSGSVWRFGLKGGTNPSAWTRSLLFRAEEPITATPAPVYGNNGEVLLYFGTGAYLDQDDFDNDDQQYFYCVVDRHDGLGYGTGDLVDQTVAGQPMAGEPGWYVELWHMPGERVTEQAVVVAKTVYFTAYAPTTVTCGVGGHSWLYQLNWDDAANPLDEDDQPLDRDIDLGDGVAARPVADIINEDIIVQSSDATIEVHDIGPVYFPLNVKSWQENYDFVGAQAAQADIGQ